MAPGMDPRHDVSVAGGCKPILAKLNRYVSHTNLARRGEERGINKRDMTEMDWHQQVPVVAGWVGGMRRKQAFRVETLRHG